jgi:hypothetical protein
VFSPLARAEHSVNEDQDTDSRVHVDVASVSDAYIAPPFPPKQEQKVKEQLFSTKVLPLPIVRCRTDPFPPPSLLMFETLVWLRIGMIVDPKEKRGVFAR